MSEQEEKFSIGEVAVRSGLDPDTLRYFERQGVLPAPRRDSAGRRQYVAPMLT
jgi:DNA-binding transcriptional MerR regulator